MRKRRKFATRFPRAAHNHRHCVTDALNAAEEIAVRRRLRFTPLRRRVFEIVSKSHRPLGAYDVLHALGKTRERSTRLAPPTVYRALDFLSAQGFVHRVDTLNAYVACFAPKKPHRAYFFLCENCGRAAEIESRGLIEALQACARAADFSVARETVEIAGRCRECAEQPI